MLAYSVQAAQNKLNKRSGSFELLGCDIMLDDQMNPKLIEFNTNPALSIDIDVLSIQINGKTKKRHPNPLDGIQDLEMVQLHSGVKETLSETQFGHLTLCQSKTEFKECEKEDLISFHRYEREEALNMLSDGKIVVNGQTHFQTHFDIVKTAKNRLETACITFEGDQRFPRGMQNISQLQGTSQSEECGVYVYTNSCLWRFIYSVKDKPEALNSIDLCRHMLKNVDDLYIQLEWLSLQPITEITKLHNEIKIASEKICCNHTCLRCDESANANACIECDATLFRQLVTSTRDGLDISQCNCQRGYQEIYGQCIQCSIGCLECADNICQVCDSEHGFQLSGQSCGCGAQQFVETVDGVHRCTNCDDSCKTCQNSTSCSSCDESREINYLTGLCDCRLGRYEFEGQQYCPICHYSCKTCTRPQDSSVSLGTVDPISLETDVNYGEGQCLICQQDREKENNKSITEPSRCLCKTCHWDSKNDRTCKPMDTANRVCTAANGPNSTDCTECHVNAIKTESGTCVAKPGYYFDTQISCGFVTQCNQTCAQCNGPNADNCTECPEQRRFENGTCICRTGYGPNCSSCDLTCGTCIGANSNECLTCSSENREVQNQRTLNGQIVHECPPKPGFFEQTPIQSEPGKCNDLCKTCVTNADNCTSCLESQNREHLSPENRCECKDGFFQDGTALICRQCQETHRECQSQNHATACYDNQNRVLDHTRNDCVCIEGFFELDGNPICQACNERCQACKDSEHNCTVCKDHQAREAPVNGSCFCGEHQFWSSEVCQECHPSCQTCTDGDSQHCITTNQPQSYIEGTNVFVNHIFILPNNAKVNRSGENFVQGVDGVSTIREYFDKKVQETIQSIYHKEQIAFGELIIKEKSLEEEIKDRFDVFSLFYYTPAETNPEQEFYFRQSGPQPQTGLTSIPNNTIENNSNVDVALKNIIDKAEAKSERYIIYLVVHDITDETEINNVKKQLDDIFKENNPLVVQVNVLEIGTANPRLIPEVKEELQPIEKTSVIGTCTTIEECLALADQVQEQKENPIHDNRQVHNIFITPNSISSTTPINVQDVKHDQNAFLPQALVELITNGQITIQQITQFTITQIIQQIISNERNIIDEQLKERSTVLDYNPVNTERRFENLVNSNTLITNNLPLSNVRPQTPSPGVSNLSNAINLLDQIADSSPADVVIVVTIFIDGTEERTQEQTQAILNEIKKISEDNSVIKVNILEILSEPRHQLIDEVNVTRPQDEDIIDRTSNTIDLIQITKELTEQPNPHVQADGRVNHIFVMPNDHNSNIEKKISEINQINSQIPNEEVTTVTILSNQSIREIVNHVFTEFIIHEHDQDYKQQSVTVLDYQPDAMILEKARLQLVPVTSDNRTQIENKLQESQITPTKSQLEGNNNPANLVQTLNYVDNLIYETLRTHPNDKFVVTIYLDDSNPDHQLTQEQIVQVSELKDRFDQYGLINIISILAQSNEPEIVDKIRDIVPTKIQPVRASVDDFTQVNLEITQKLVDQVVQTVQDSQESKKVKHVILTPNDDYTRAIRTADQLGSTTSLKIREIFQTINNQYVQAVISSNQGIPTDSNKQTFTLIEYDSDSAANAPDQRRVPEQIPNQQLVDSNLNLNSHPDRTGKPDLLPELHQLLEQIKADLNSEYILTFQFTDNFGKDYIELYINEMNQLINLLQDPQQFPNVTVNVVQYRLKGTTSTILDSITQTALSNKSLRPIIETVSTIEDIAEILAKIDQQTELLPGNNPTNNEQINYRFIVPNTKNAREGLPASDLKENKITVIPDALENVIKSFDDQVSPQRFAQSVIETVVDQLREDQTHFTNKPTVNIVDYSPTQVSQRVNDVSISVLTDQQIDLSNVIPAIITSDAKGQLKEAILQAIQQAQAQSNVVTVLTIFIDHNIDNPLTQTEISNVLTEVQALVGLANIPVINVITTDFEPKEDVIDKIKDQTTPLIVLGLKEADDTIEEVNETIQQLINQQENVPEPKEGVSIHNIFLTPNTPNCRISHPIEDIMAHENSSLPDVLRNKQTVQIQEIVQYLITEVVKGIVHEEQDLQAIDKSKLTVYDYNPSGVTTRVDGIIPTEDTVNNDLRLTNVTPQTPTGEGVGNINASLEQVISEIKSSSNERFVVTLIIDGTKPLTEVQNEQIAITIKELQDNAKLVTFNLIIIETKEKELVQQISKELVPEERPGLIASCETALECNARFQELQNQIPSTQDVSVNLTYQVIIVQNTERINTQFQHTSDRFKPLQTKRDIIEYTLDAFINEWTTINHESGVDQPLTIIYVNENDTPTTPLDKNLPEDFDLLFPEQTNGTTPNFNLAIDKLLEIIQNAKNSDKFQNIDFKVTIIGVDQDLKIDEIHLQKLEEKLQNDGALEPKISSLDIIRLQDTQETNTQVLENALQPKEETPGVKINTKTPDEFYDVLTHLPCMPQLPTSPQNVQCQIGSFINPDFRYRSDPYCLACHKTCKSCVSLGIAQCTSCSEYDNREPSSNLNQFQCVCKTGFESVNESRKCYPKCTEGQYRDATTRECKPCDVSCQNCTGPLDSNCSQCRAGEYVALNGDCQQCADAIEHCTSCGLENGAVVCNQCNTTLHREASDNRKTCDCQNGFVLVEGECKIECQVGQYRVSVIQCSQCSPICQACSLSETTCTSCDESNHRRNPPVVGVCQCEDGFYDDGSNLANCIQCPVNCLTCDGQGRCTQCDTTRNFREIVVEGRCECTEGYGFNQTQHSGECILCHQHCVTCLIGGQNGQCDTCQEGRIESGTAPNKTCGECNSEDGRYTDTVNQTCPKCHFTCGTCNGPNANNCLTCVENSNRVHNATEFTCNPCAGTTGSTISRGTNSCFETQSPVAGICDITCKTCSGPDVDDCLTCHEKFVRSDAYSETSTCNPIDFFTKNPDDPTTAILCDKSCGKTCTDNTSLGCTECLTEYRNVNNQGCECKPGSYSDYDSAFVDPSQWADPNHSFCTACHYSCEHCRNNAVNGCSICDQTQGRYLTGNGETLECKCNNGLYDDGHNEQCQSCPIGCQTCSLVGGNIECSLCHESRLLGEDKLCNAAPPGNYIPNKGTPSEEPNTKPCHYTCYRCEGGSAANQCTECSASWNRVERRVGESIECPPALNHYEQPSEHIAPSCNYHCITCSGPNHEDCLECNAEKNFEKLDPTRFHNGVWTAGICTAKPGYYDNQPNEIGEICHRSCQTCLNGADTGCITCRWQDALIKNTSSGQLNGQTVQHGLCEAKDSFYIPENHTYPPSETNPACLHLLLNSEGKPDDCWQPLPCDQSCQSCVVQATNCTDCDNTNHLILRITNNTCVCAQGYYNSNGTCNECKIECLTCNDQFRCTQCKGNFTQVKEDGTCTCIEGTESLLASINCEPIIKPNIVVPGVTGEIEEENEQCIVIKKITKEGSSGWLDFVQIAEALSNHKQISPAQLIQSSRAFNRTRKSLRQH